MANLNPIYGADIPSQLGADRLHAHVPLPTIDAADSSKSLRLTVVETRGGVETAGASCDWRGGNLGNPGPFTVDGFAMPSIDCAYSKDQKTPDSVRIRVDSSDASVLIQPVVEFF